MSAKAISVSPASVERVGVWWVLIQTSLLKDSPPPALPSSLLQPLIETHVIVSHVIIIYH